MFGLDGPCHRPSVMPKVSVRLRTVRLDRAASLKSTMRAKCGNCCVLLASTGKFGVESVASHI
jgi:hypothetical protein